MNARFIGEIELRMCHLIVGRPKAICRSRFTSILRSTSWCGGAELGLVQTIENWLYTYLSRYLIWCRISLLLIEGMHLALSLFRDFRSCDV